MPFTAGSIIYWLVVLFLAVCVFFLCQYFIPLLFNLIGLHLPPNIVNIFSILIAVAVVFGGWGYRQRVVAP